MKYLLMPILLVLALMSGAVLYSAARMVTGGPTVVDKVVGVVWEQGKEVVQLPLNKNELRPIVQ
ncbi:hypothetical protein SIID45300_02245 [Candidatus Magnetaquicoccaceae bacterium FCR-1]|uniref:Uncharacterized protein n=1 Tax=Candidatus Magnetaquiglobus chichijimensis TaxID=3141448 RepID=A0ABQ0CAK3_9PROT